MPFRTPFYIPFRKLIPPFTLTAEYQQTYRSTYRPIVTDDIGRPSVARHIDQHVDRDPADMSADTRPTCDSRYVYRYSVDISIDKPMTFARYSTDTRPILYRYLVDSLLLSFISSLYSNVSCLRCPRAYF